MDAQIIKDLCRLSAEEKLILGGQKVKQDDYTLSKEFIVNSEKVLGAREIDMRLHTRFIDFPEHGHDYTEFMYVYAGSITHVIEGGRITLQSGDILLLNKHIAFYDFYGGNMSEIIARRQFDPLYIWLDIAFLAVFAALLLWRKKYMTFLVGLVFGLVYFAVDYGIFHLVCHARTISEGYSLFWVLLWMSMSYGFTNFVWIWLWISKDKNLFEWSLFILCWWLCAPMLAATFGGNTEPIVIQRTTGSYHGYMAIILFVGYLALIAWNLMQRDKTLRVNILWLLAIGILVQFGWEAGLLLGGIRSAGFTSFADKLLTLVTNSLLETNLGMPYIYVIFLAYSARCTERLRRRAQSLPLLQRLEENNAERVRGEEVSEYLA